MSGFPSRYARRLVEHALAANPGSFVYLVVPPTRAHEAARAIEALGDAGRRTCVLEGDPTAMDLGLSGAELALLGREVDLVHHAMHASFVGQSEREAEETNVASALEIMELARASSSLRCLVFHSTTAVSGARTGVVYEEELDPQQSFHDAAERTRTRAEALARRAMKDVPIVIVRPSRVVGAAEGDRLEALHLAALVALAAKTELALALPNKGDAPIHAVPMDYVARAAHALGHMEKARGRTFHLVDPHPISARRFFDVVAREARRSSAGAILAGLSATSLLRAPGIDQVLRKPKSFLAQIAAPVFFDARATTNLLAGTGIECPPFEAYADELVAEILAHVREMRPKMAPSRRALESEVDDPLS